MLLLADGIELELLGVLGAQGENGKLVALHRNLE